VLCDAVAVHVASLLSPASAFYNLNCAVGQWTSYGACSVTCGGGVQYRTRSVISFPFLFGSPCPALSESLACNTHACILPTSTTQLYNGRVYQAVTAAVDYATALRLSSIATFKGLAGHLVTITSAEENAFVTGLLKMSWIAVDDRDVEGVFKYSAGPDAGSLPSYTAWGPGQPDNWLGNEDCVHLWDALSLPKNWNDRPCTEKMTYVIEYECPAGQLFTSSGCQGMCHCIMCLLGQYTRACMLVTHPYHPSALISDPLCCSHRHNACASAAQHHAWQHPPH
jgi:hypothetical protein